MTTHEVRMILEDVISRHLRIDDGALVDITTEIIERLEEEGLWDEDGMSYDKEPSYDPFGTDLDTKD